MTSRVVASKGTNESVAQQWVGMTDARVATWPETGATRTLRTVDASSGAKLGPGELLVVAVDPGDRVRLVGLGRLGLGTGTGDLPDAITWSSDAHELRVPTWSTARFVVARATKDDATITLDVARGESDPFRWYRFDEHVRDLLWKGSALQGEDTPEGAKARARATVAFRSLLGDDRSESSARFLMSDWLESALRVRPVAPPYFSKRAVELAGGTRVPNGEAPETARFERRALSEREHVEVRTSGASVVRVHVQASRVTTTRVVVFEGDVPIQVLEFRPATRTVTSDRWTAPETVRAVVPEAETRVRVEVIEGAALVAVEAFTQRTDVLDAFSRKRVREHDLDVARERAPGRCSTLVAAIAASTATESRPAYDALRTFGATARLLSSERALLAVELVLHAPEIAPDPRALRAAWSALRGIPVAARAPIARRMLERLADLNVTRLDPSVLPDLLGSDAVARGADTDDVEAVSELTALVTAVDRRAAARGAAHAEMRAATDASREGATVLSRRSWVRKTEWSLLSPTADTRQKPVLVVPHDETFAEGRCSVMTASGPRFTWLADTVTPLAVAAPGGTHARVTVRTQDDDAREVSMRIDDDLVTVHGLAGLPALVAVAAGVRRFERPPGRPLLARVPREGLVPCAELREVERWGELPDEARFVVRETLADTAGRVVVEPASLAGGARTLIVHTANADFEAWVRAPATGAVEVPVPLGSTAIDVSSASQLLVRASIRLPAEPLPRTRFVTARPSGGGETEAALLARLRETTRALRSAPDRGVRAALRGERASILAALGASRLSDAERARTGQPPEEDDERAGNAASVMLPEGSPNVVSLSVATDVPPLHAPADPAPLARARELDLEKQPAPAVAAPLVTSACDSDGADALLLASATERAGLADVSSAAYARIGAATRSGRALARAATLRADVAVSEHDAGETLAAFLLARQATAYGDAATEVLSRLAGAISWVNAAGAESGAASAVVEETGANGAVTLGTKIRRALLDAPDAASMIAEGRRVAAYFKERRAKTLDVETVCSVLAGPEECALTTLLDGNKVACDAAPAVDPSDLTEPSRSRTCPVSVPSGGHRLDVLLPESDAVASVVLRDGTTKIPVASRIVSTWHDIQGDRALELHFAAPTVLRVVARSSENRPTTLSLAIERGGDPANVTPWALGGTATEERYIPVPEAGNFVLRVTSTEARALVRVEAAFPSGLPRARTESQVAPLESEPNGRVLASTPLVLPTVGEATSEGPLLVGASATFQRTDLSEFEGSREDQNLQLTAYALREFFRRRAWAEGSIFYRARSGTDSEGFTIGAWASSRRFVPGGYARALVVRQPFREKAAVSFYGVAGVLWSIPVGPDVALVPWTDVILRRAGVVPDGETSIDSDLYTQYAMLHPVSWNIGLKADHRPFADVLLSYGGAMRYGPSPAAIDRLDGVVTLDALPGDGLSPWLSASIIASRRPPGPVRPEGFTRLTGSAQALFWQWARETHHLLLGGKVTEFRDFPDGVSSFSFALTLGYEQTLGRGLADYAPRNAPFWGRLEEGDGRVGRAAPARDAAWESLP